MKKYLRKKKFGLGICIILVLIVLAGFFAFNTSNKTKVKTTVIEKLEDTKTDELSHCEGVSGVFDDENGAVAQRYNIEGDVTEEEVGEEGVNTEAVSSLSVTINPAGSDNILSRLRTVKFKLASINGKSLTDEYLLYFGHDLNIPMHLLNDYKASDNDDAELTFTAEDAIIINPGGTEDCLASVRFSLIIDNAFGGKMSFVGSDDEMVAYPEESIQSESVNCDNPTTAFEKNYCNIQGGISTGAKVVDKGDFSAEVKSGSGNYQSSRIALSCDAATIHDKSPEDANYFSNVATMSATYEEAKDLGLSYRYRFAPGNYFYDKEPLKCTIKCTEKVRVEYGPPIATKAGLCFEYQVKATSYVSCKTVTKPTKPVQFKGYCDPKPRCVHKNFTITRAGPDDDFDDCIDSCDGGKYTDICSQKCYDKVYSNNNKKMLNYADYNYSKKIVSSLIESQVNECLAVAKSGYKFWLHNYSKTEKGGSYGCYYWTSSDHKSISWWGDDDGDKQDNTPCRYYKDKDPNRDYSKYVVAGYGFVRRKHSDGDYCHAKCHYSTSTCKQYFNTANRANMLSKNEYLNPGMAKADNAYNKSVYDQAVALCKAKASCNTTEATFTINVTSGTTTTNDNLSYKNGVLNENKSYDEKIKNSAFLKEFGGCYKDASIKNLSYMARWGFRGACINTKYGTLVNTSGKCDTGYARYPGKYCIPLNETNVNTEWWNYYYTKLYESMGIDPEAEAIGVDSAKFKDDCECNWKVNSLAGFNPKPNIVASTTDFGYFKWDLDVSCFYATNNKICEEDSHEECISEGYNIRTIDLRNMFPNKDGKPSASDATGRLPGFNWSKYATHSKKDKNYTSYPSEYIKWVQGKEYTIYSDDYLDYQVRLTREKIRELKKTTAANDFKYTNYQEYTGGSKIDSVVNYKSALLRNTLQDYTILPTDDSLVCNNMHNHNSGCETFK